MRWLSAVVVLALAVAGAMARAQSDGPPMSGAADALRAGDPVAAEQRADQELASDALQGLERARALMNRGLAREALGKRQDALVDFTMAIAMRVFAKTDQARALFDRGVTLDELGHVEDAVGDYSASLRLEPHFAAALNNRANAYRRLNRLGEAKRDYLASLAAGNLAPEYPDFGLGRIAEAQGDLAAARDFYGKALAADPHYTIATQRLAALTSAVPDKPDPAAPIVLKPPPRARIAKVVAPRKAWRVVAAAGSRVAAAGSRPTLAPASYGPAGSNLTLRPAIEEAATPPAHQLPATGPIAQPPLLGPQVQLGAWRDEASAAAGWNTARKQAGDALTGLTPKIVAVDLPGKGLYFRLRAVPVGGKGAAAALCEQLQARGLACMVVRGS